MQSENRNFYLMLLILVILVGFIFYTYRSKDTRSFGDVVELSNARLDSINAEIKRSKQLIHDTNDKLDGIQKDMVQIKDKQGVSNTNVSNNDQQLKEKIREQEKELNAVKNKYSKVKQERDMISLKLDSLADIIGDF